MIDCKAMTEEIYARIKASGAHGHLAVISVGDDSASESYVKAKEKACKRCGFGFTHYHFEDGTDEADIVDACFETAHNPDVTGVIVQLPLPPSYGAEFEKFLTEFIVPAEKDVDGFRSDSPFKPCTPEGILHILRHELGTLEGKTVCVVGRGKLVGKPLREMLDEENATIISCNSKTEEGKLYNLCYDADAVVLATGQAQWFMADQFTDDAFIVDCGCFRGDNGKLCGEVKNASSTQDMITPVPGGVGPMTVAKLMEHVGRANE